jgi:hypothetical protein
MDTAVSSSVYCRQCGLSLSHVWALKDHIKRDHQRSVKAKFQDDTVINIGKGDDGTFQCLCARHFALPSSLRRHARSCEGDVSMKRQDGLKEELSEEEMEDDSKEHGLPIDCVGKFPRLICTELTLFFPNCRG